MGKKKKNGAKRAGNRFFRWIRSDLPDEEDKKSPVLLLGVNKISDSPSFVRRRSIDHPTGSIRFFRPIHSKYTRGINEDLRLEKIRQDLLLHKTKSDNYIPKSHDVSVEKEDRCLKLNCVGSCICERKRSDRGSFSFRSDRRQTSLCPSEPYRKTEDYSEQDIEFKYTEHPADCQPSSSKTSYNITPKSADRRSFLLSNLNERFRKTLSLDSRKIETNRAPLSLPKEARPKSLVNTSNIVQTFRADEPFLNKFDKPQKKKRKSFFSLETFFDSKKSDTSSIDDFCSSKYKRFELEEDSPLFRRENQNQREKTPDLLNLPLIIDSVRKKQSDTRKQLEKLESHYYKSLKTSKTIIDSVPKDAKTEPNGHTNHVYIDDDDVEYIEPIGCNNQSNFTSESTLILDKTDKPESVLTIYTDETDIRLPSSTISPKSDVRGRENDLDSIGAYEIEVKESDLLKVSKELTVKVMDKSVDSIGSCSLDVDASTDFSDTTSGSLNLLTPSSTTSRIREFNSRFQERANQCLPEFTTPTRTPEDLTPTPRKEHRKREPERPEIRRIPETQKLTRDTHHSKTPDLRTQLENIHRPGSRTPELKTKDNRTSEFKNLDSKKFESELKNSDSKKFDNEAKRLDNLLKPPSKLVSSSHRSRTHHKKRDEGQKKPSYLNLACSVNGYTNLTTYDSKLRQDINKSREASPIRPITHAYHYRSENNSLLVPVPVSANKLLVSSFSPNDTNVHLTPKAPTKAHTDPYLATPHVFMAEENKQLKNNFLGANMTTTTRPYISTESKNFASSMLHQDELDNSKEITFKSSYSESNFRKSVNGKEVTNTQRVNSESYTISANGLSKRVEITKENGERLPSPMKSFIQQRVERLYGPGALAQGFLMQKRSKTSVSEEESLPDRSFNHQTDFNSLRKEIECVSPNGDDSNVSLPVLRHLRPEFRAQLPILSPKKTFRSDISPQKIDIPIKTEVINNNGSVVRNLEISSVNDGVVSVSNGVSVLTVGGVNGKAEVDKEVIKDAYYFLALKKNETERLIALAEAAEKELEGLQDKEVSEEVMGLIRAAAGKARLLATQKMQQFEGLCYNHINERENEPFPTTLQDLQGFWDMVCLQLRHVDTLHEQLAKLRLNQWRESPPPTAPPPSSATPRRPRATPTVKNEKARLAAEKREQDRKALLEQRRKVARERMLAQPAQDAHIEGNQEVEIFVGKGAKPSLAPQGDCVDAPTSQLS